MIHWEARTKPSRAIASAGGFTEGLRYASTEWLKASMPVAAVNCAGRESVNSGSAITVLATILRFTATHLRPESNVITQARPISAPVPAAVGIAI